MGKVRKKDIILEQDQKVEFSPGINVKYNGSTVQVIGAPVEAIDSTDSSTVATRGYVDSKFSFGPGTSGTSGSSGTSGTDGTTGIDGISGTSGSSGTSGIDGTTGSSGTSGTSGISGTSPDATGIIHTDLKELENDDHTQYSINEPGSVRLKTNIDSPEQDQHLFYDSTNNIFINNNPLPIISCGSQQLNNGDNTAIVVFNTPQDDTDYITIVSLANNIDNLVSIYRNIISNRTVNGFLVEFSDDMDSDNYVLDWITYYEVVVTTPALPEKGYIFGGFYSGGGQRDTDEYDPDTWTSKTDLPLPGRFLFAASTISSKGYVYGGGYNNDCDEYTPDTWASKTDIPSPGRKELAASTINDKGYIYCGYANANPWFLRDTDEYTPDSWANKTNCPARGRNTLCASTISDKGYIYCGYTNSVPQYMQDCDEYDPDTWTGKTDAPSPGRRNSAACTIDNKGYIFCGHSGSYLRDTDEYTPDTWTSKTDCPLPARYLSAASTIDNKGYIYCGEDSGGLLMQDCDEYTPDTWVNKTDSPSPSISSIAASTI